MKTTSLLAKHIREFYSGGNWTYSNLKDSLKDITYDEALKSVHGINSIAVLVNHMHYYIPRVIAVLEGGELVGDDSMSWTPPPLTSQQDWNQWIERIFNEAEHFSKLIEELPDSILAETFQDEKYGNYFRNISGILEHHHYHLGQINIIKKIIKEQTV